MKESTFLRLIAKEKMKQKDLKLDATPKTKVERPALKQYDLGHFEHLLAAIERRADSLPTRVKLHIYDLTKKIREQQLAFGRALTHDQKRYLEEALEVLEEAGRL
jgi:hypothetical protein